MMCARLTLFYPSHSSRVLSGVGLVGGNPAMNTPRLRGGEDCFFFNFFSTCSVSSIVYFVCDSASELEW